MKIMTILGTRPEIIRLSRIIPLLDKYSNHILINTNQNFAKELNEIFFKELRLREPDYILDTESNSLFGQISKIFIGCEKIILENKPDRLLVLGDTNSALTAIIAKRYGVRVFHLEAGNRCYDDRVPEEVNRRIIDHCSDILMPYTERSRQNIIKEGIPNDKIYVVGNPIKEVIDFYSDLTEKSNIINKLGIKKNFYFLVTLHRSENVDHIKRLENFLKAFELIFDKFNLPVVFSIHPRTKSKLKNNNYEIKSKKIYAIPPPGFFDFINLEKNAKCVLTDSGTVQEECCILGVPNVTIRDVTERPETIESGSNILSGNNPKDILKAIDISINCSNNWNPPLEYNEKLVSLKVLKIISGFNI